jgi:hypothetical protein
MASSNQAKSDYQLKSFNLLFSLIHSSAKQAQLLNLSWDSAFQGKNEMQVLFSKQKLQQPS